MLKGWQKIGGISTHALREEGDAGKSVRNQKRHISTHALREEGDEPSRGPAGPQGISTHALREEGDQFAISPDIKRAIFLPTPSARRATQPVDGLYNYCPISTHALREEGDYRTCAGLPTIFHFYPRPPRGGRP